eukprot:Em0020g1044a
MRRLLHRSLVLRLQLLRYRPHPQTANHCSSLSPQMNFSCHGCFQTLNITLKEGVSSDSTFYFQLWRRYTPTSGQTPVVTNELYQLNTSVPLTISTTSVSSSNVYSLPLDVCFHEGDTIGIQLPSNSLLRIATDNSSVIYKREVPAQCSDVVSGIFQPSLNYTGSPLITLVTAPSSPSPTPVTLIGTSTISKETPTAVLLGATPTANPCTDNCSTLIAKSSVAIGLGAAAFCAVAIVMMMLLYCTIKAMVDRRKYQCGNEILALDPDVDDFKKVDKINMSSHNETVNSFVDNRRRGRRHSSNPKAIDSYASLYQVNGELHMYQELVEAPSPAIGKKTDVPVDQLANSGSVIDDKRWLINKLIIDQEDGDTNESLPAQQWEDRQALEMVQNGYSCLTHFKGMEHDSQDVSSNDTAFWNPPSSIQELYNVISKHKYREVHRDDLSITSVLGSGNFGTVYKGMWTFSGGQLNVAIKMLKDGASEEDKVKFLQEAAIMGQLSHLNVVKMYGVVTMGDPLVMALELMARGDLRNFVLSCRQMESTQHPSPIPIPKNLPKTFVSFAKDVACGMTYLSRKNFVHRDLAARNVFLTEDLRCKIGDFGMARDLTQSYACIYQSQGGLIPLKWSAPEAIQHYQYNTASDVWSFGMVLYEVWSLGHTPFGNESVNKVGDLVTTGYCQPPPPGCPRAIYELMVQCWHPKAAERPSFSELYHELGKPVEDLLVWTPEDRECGEHVSELGAPMACSRNLYPDLQNMYTR